MEPKIRLIGLADAGEQAGGTVFYATVKRRNGKYMTTLLTARSKLLNSTVPRNELMSVLLMAETLNMLHMSMKDIINDVILLTDSTVALSWVHNAEKRLKVFVGNRVETIRRYIEWSDVRTDPPPTVPHPWIGEHSRYAHKKTTDFNTRLECRQRVAEWQTMDGRGV